MSSAAARIAEAWVGTDFHPGQTEQCAVFVRHVFRKAGIDLPVAKHPTDWEQTKNQAQGPGYANSFAGDEVGRRITRIADLRPGDIVMWRNTYGDYARGTITHVGIYVGGGMFVHRPTSTRPVEKAHLSGFWADLFVEGRRPLVADKPEPKKTVRFKLFEHGGKRRLVVPEPLPPGTYDVVASEEWVEVVVE